jgi:glyceraldehyde-3-phosphate dehydrogenase (NAD(P))
MRVLVAGLGNIGATLASLLAKFRKELGIDDVIGLKRGEVLPWQEPDLALLAQTGVSLRFSRWRKGLPGDTAARLEHRLDYAFECGADGTGIDSLDWYRSMKGLAGACAQGSERSFGEPFMAGLNDGRPPQAFVHAPSCNTHAIAAILRALSGSPGQIAERVAEADFVVVRRCEDLGARARLVGANVIARHRDRDAGTHHASDALELFATIGASPRLQSSDVTTPSQLLHATRFDVRLAAPIDIDALRSSIATDPLVSTTAKFDSNAIFELGRRYGEAGRLYSQAIVADHDLLVSEGGARVKGWAFVPQEGNTILSTVRAFLARCLPADADRRFEGLRAALVRPRW